MEFIISLIPYLMPIINIVCLVLKKGKIVSLIATLIGVLPALLLLAINGGYGIGFGNPWIGVDWTYTVIMAVYIAFMLATHWFVPSTGVVKKISVVVVVLVVLCAAFLIGLAIVDTIHHSDLF